MGCNRIEESNYLASKRIVKASIKVDKDNSDQRFVTLRGEWESILTALNLILECIEDKKTLLWAERK